MRIDDAEEIYVYRGVHGGHPAYADARLGRVSAANPKGKLTPGVHHAGGRSDESQFTSWSYSFDIALEFARSRTPPQSVGLVLRFTKSATSGDDAYRWVEYAIDREQEVLLVGTIVGAEVIYDGSEGDYPSPA